MDKNINLIWLPISLIDTEILDSLGIDNSFLEYLPIFLFDEQSKETNSKSFNFSFINILFGLVYGYTRISQTFADVNETKTKYQFILNHCLNTSAYKSLEEMLLNMPDLAKNKCNKANFENFMKSFNTLFNDINIKNQ